jgi:hypothetical protein
MGRKKGGGLGYKKGEDILCSQFLYVFSVLILKIYIKKFIKN